MLSQSWWPWKLLHCCHLHCTLLNLTYQSYLRQTLSLMESIHQAKLPVSSELYGSLHKARCLRSSFGAYKYVFIPRFFSLQHEKQPCYIRYLEGHSIKVELSVAICLSVRVHNKLQPYHVNAHPTG